MYDATPAPSTEVPERTRSRYHRARRLTLTVLVSLSLVLSGGVALGDDGAGEGGKKRKPRRYYLNAMVGGTWVGADLTGSTNTDGAAPSTTINDQNPFGGAALGTILDLGWSDLRLELEGVGGRSYTYRFSTTSGEWVTTADSWQIQGNFWFEYGLDRLMPDTPILKNLAPFAGGGVGFSRAKLSTSGPGASGSRDNTTFAWQVGAGLAYHLTDWLVIDTRYQYADLGKTDVIVFSGGTREGKFEFDTGTNEIVGSLRFVLPSN